MGTAALGMRWPATAVVTHKYNDKSEKFKSQLDSNQKLMKSRSFQLPLVLSQKNNGKQFGLCVCRGRWKNRAEKDWTDHGDERKASNNNWIFKCCLLFFQHRSATTMKKLARPNPLLKCNQIVAENAARGLVLESSWSFGLGAQSQTTNICRPGQKPV